MDPDMKTTCRPISGPRPSPAACVAGPRDFVPQHIRRIPPPRHSPGPPERLATTGALLPLLHAVEERAGERRCLCSFQSAGTIQNRKSKINVPLWNLRVWDLELRPLRALHPRSLIPLPPASPDRGTSSRSTSAASRRRATPPDLRNDSQRRALYSLSSTQWRRGPGEEVPLLVPKRRHNPKSEIKNQRAPLELAGLEFGTSPLARPPSSQPYSPAACVAGPRDFVPQHIRRIPPPRHSPGPPERLATTGALLPPPRSGGERAGGGAFARSKAQAQSKIGNQKSTCLSGTCGFGIWNFIPRLQFIL